MRQTLVALTLFCSLLTVGCSGTQNPASQSQTVLVETGTILADIDSAQAASMRERHETCGDEHLCLVELAERAEPVVVALEAAHGALATWETANDAWRTSGSPQPNWDTAICRPLQVAVETLLEALEGFGHPIPDLWAGLMRQADEACSLGVALIGGSK